LIVIFLLSLLSSPPQLSSSPPLPLPLLLSLSAAVTIAVAVAVVNAVDVALLMSTPSLPPLVPQPASPLPLSSPLLLLQLLAVR
jgi:hypothetical protein